MDLNSSPRAMQIKADYPELNGLDPNFMARLNLEAIFLEESVKGATKINRKKVPLLQLAAPVISRMLFSGEAIEFIARGVLFSPAEQMYAHGIWARFANITTVILTNYRLLFLNTDGKGRPLDMNYHQARFDRLTAVKSGSFFPNFQLSFGKRNIKTFQELSKPDRQALKDRLSPKVGQPSVALFPEIQGDTGGFENLCPVCFRPVPLKTYHCPTCQAAFRTPGQAALRGLFLPGLGDLYLGRKTLGAFKAVVYLLVYVILIGIGVADPKIENFIMAIIIIPALNIMDSLVTYFTAKKGLVPASPPAANPAGQILPR